MSWVHDLYETSKAVQVSSLPDKERFWPVGHVVKMVHVEIVLDSFGDYIRLKKLEGEERLTLIPATENSAGRTRGTEPHPLCEELSYCASDFPKGSKERYSKYIDLLQQWESSKYTHSKIKAIFTFVKKGILWQTLNSQGLFPLKTIDWKGKKTPIKEGKVFVRWRVEEEDALCTGTWEDHGLIQSWILFERTRKFQTGFCMVTGQQTRVAKNHPRFIRNSSDGAKIISSNDFDGFTFRGRFTDTKDTFARQACTVGYETSQLLHSALRWLINRQGFKNGSQVFVAWALGLQAIPDFQLNTKSLLKGKDDDLVGYLYNTSEMFAGDFGQHFAKRLNRFIAGYKANIKDTESIVIIGLDSVKDKKGRLAITFYRKISGSEFLERLENWHKDMAWLRRFGKDIYPCAPAPKEIVVSAFGKKIEGENGKKLHKSTIDRIIPCIIDGQIIPRDLVNLCIYRACHRLGFNRNILKKDEREWEDCLSVACALFKGINKEREYDMILEEDRKTRDYLFGRLLAVAEHIEQVALNISQEKRDTNAAKLMQRFRERPASTWVVLYVNHLPPYQSRVRSRWPGYHEKLKDIIDKITLNFVADDFISDRCLGGEFLLGYSCQRQKLHEKNKKEELIVQNDQQNTEGENDNDHLEQ